ncbi:GRAS transcription factor [Rhynchospora pubera]|uniref:GRAS transcription factor n=1 Tax=Rhynchospora pubera TaxID=906938 RepID=A0AAV8ENC7_9POAL|nr:GRAS transcription factor [Rhynchospora pubera]
MVGASSELFLTSGRENPTLHNSQNAVLDKPLDATLSYLSKILLEENIDENHIILYEEGMALTTMEKSLSDIISQNYSPSLNDPSPLNQQQAYPTSFNQPVQYQIIPSLVNLPASEYSKGLEEGMKFLPNIEKLRIDFQGNNLSIPSPCNLNEEKSKNQGSVINGSNSKKKLNNEDLDILEGRNCKIPQSYSEEPVRDQKLDEVILYNDDYIYKVASLREGMKANMRIKQTVKEHFTDVKDLLIRCSHLVATSDCQAAEDIIKQIRKQSSPDGDSTHRLALVLADALEARLTGTGSEVYNRFVSKRISTSDILKIQYLLMTLTPFLRATYCIAKDRILKLVDKASKLHIIDFGIGFGFQWPSLIQDLSEQKDGVVKLKITGIDFPRPGFRPTERVDETGRRLAEYAKSFNVPFEYNGIVSKLEDICNEDLKIEKDELLVVNSMYRFRQLGDESIALDSPRNEVLNFIHGLKPKLFLHGVVSASFSPFFVTRFRQVMLHYASMFDILDAFVPRDNKVRQLIEREMLAREVLNLIACEGAASVERPETYKQWHLRNMRAGFEQIPVESALLEWSQKKLKAIFDNRYFMEEDSNWILLGWRGKTLHALSMWKPKQGAA